MSQKKKKQQLLILIIFLLLVATAGLGFYVYKLTKNEIGISKELKNKQDEFFITYAKLDSLSIRLKEALREKERMGEVDDSLRAVIEQLEKEKTLLRNSKNLSLQRYNDIKEKLEGYKNILSKKDRNISQLTNRNKTLKNEKNTLEVEKTELTKEVEALKSTTDEISTRLHDAAVLKIYDIKTVAINKKGKERMQSVYKRKQIEKLKIIFNVGENKAADPGNRKIFMRLLDSQQQLVESANTGTFDAKGVGLKYSASKEILFDKNQQNVTILLQTSTPYQKGNYTIEFYIEGLRSGISKFSVK